MANLNGCEADEHEYGERGACYSGGYCDVSIGHVS